MGALWTMTPRSTRRKPGLGFNSGAWQQLLINNSALAKGFGFWPSPNQAVSESLTSRLTTISHSVISRELWERILRLQNRTLIRVISHSVQLPKGHDVTERRRSLAPSHPKVPDRGHVQPQMKGLFWKQEVVMVCCCYTWPTNQSKVPGATSHSQKCCNHQMKHEQSRRRDGLARVWSRYIMLTTCQSAESPTPNLTRRPVASSNWTLTKSLLELGV